jgi:outer membrane biosynthesis protein TonB
VQEVRQKAKLTLVALGGAAAGAVLVRLRRRPAEAPGAPPDDRAEELRRKLAEARAAVADEADFEAAGMGAETLVEEPPRQEVPAPAAPDVLPEPPPEPEQPPPPPEPVEPPSEPEEPPAPEPDPEPPAPTPHPKPEEPPAPAAAEPPPRDEFEAMRRRIHREGTAGADEMRRSAEPSEQP